MSTLARWCFRHRWIVMALWVVLLGGLFGLQKAAASKYDNSFSLPGTESTTAQQLLQQALPAQAGDSDTIVWQVSSGSVRDEPVSARITAMLGHVAHLPEVSGVVPGQVSRDGRTAYATVDFTKQADSLNKADISKVISVAEAARQPGLNVQLGGQAIENSEQEPLGISSVIGVAAAAIVLLIAFGSLLAMVLPIITALVGVGSGLLAIAPLTHAISIVDFAPILGALIGLGVGTDYALFIVTRHRRGLRAGLSAEESAVTALNTSGRAVLFAGGTVCIAILGLLVLRVSFLNGLAVACALTVVFTVLAAITLLPALLGAFGMRVLSRRQRRRAGGLRGAGSPPGAGGSGGVVPPRLSWSRWATVIQRRPGMLALAAAVVMILLAAPVTHLRLGASDQGNDPSTTTTRQAYDLLVQGFGPGFNGPLLLVAQTHGAADTAALHTLEHRLRTVPDVAAVVPSGGSNATGVQLIQVFPRTSPEDKATSDLITTLRSTVIPGAEHGTALRVYVGGVTATFADFATVITGKLPWFLIAILSLSFLLLVVAFRSVVVPATAVVMNLLSAAASFGVLTAFFQWGWGTNAFGLGNAGPVEAFLPVVTLAILFGLSMDYEVFLVSRMNEEWALSRDNARAVRVGQAETGRVITAAATIMICVFAAFSAMGQRDIAEFGIGLAAAVALDAFILRTVLVPAIMHRLGTANWWLPRWIDRALPHLAIEPPPQPAAPAPLPARAAP